MFGATHSKKTVLSISAECTRLCHVKHSELSKDKHSYKGRVVFQGNNVRDEEGYAAVFSEQGTSASHIAAAKWLDAISRMPGNDGEDSDAMGAYTQAEFQGEETWVSMPRERWPKAWIGKYHNPVVRLRLNLYGHPLAGLYWEKHCRSAILKCGFRPVTGWECLYENPTEKLYLSVYVDDFKMAGHAAALPKMWARLGKHLDLEPPIPLEQNIYLGCGQKNIPLPKKLIAEKKELYEKLLADEIVKTSEEEEKNLSDTLPTKEGKCTERGVGSSSNKFQTSSGARGDSGTPSSKAGGDSSVKSGKKKKGKATIASGKNQTKAYHYDMTGHARQCVDKYLELAKTTKESLQNSCNSMHRRSPARTRRLRTKR